MTNRFLKNRERIWRDLSSSNTPRCSIKAQLATTIYRKSDPLYCNDNHSKEEPLLMKQKRSKVYGTKCKQVQILYNKIVSLIQRVTDMKPLGKYPDSIILAWHSSFRSRRSPSVVSTWKTSSICIKLILAEWFTNDEQEIASLLSMAFGWIDWSSRTSSLISWSLQINQNDPRRRFSWPCSHVFWWPTSPIMRCRSTRDCNRWTISDLLLHNYTDRYHWQGLAQCQGESRETPSDRSRG